VVSVDQTFSTQDGQCLIDWTRACVVQVAELFTPGQAGSRPRAAPNAWRSKSATSLRRLSPHGDATAWRRGRCERAEHVREHHGTEDVSPTLEALIGKAPGLDRDMLMLYFGEDQQQQP
jgi:hypothetical protein